MTATGPHAEIIENVHVATSAPSSGCRRSGIGEAMRGAYTRPRLLLSNPAVAMGQTRTCMLAPRRGL